MKIQQVRKSQMTYFKSLSVWRCFVNSFKNLRVPKNFSACYVWRNVMMSLITWVTYGHIDRNYKVLTKFCFLRWQQFYLGWRGGLHCWRSHMGWRNEARCHSIYWWNAVRTWRLGWCRVGRSRGWDLLLINWQISIFHRISTGYWRIGENQIHQEFLQFYRRMNEKFERL